MKNPLRRLALRVLMWGSDDLRLENLRGMVSELTGRQYGSITTHITGPDGKSLGVCSRTTTRPAEDYRIMSFALELAQAIQLRNVVIDPHTFYKHVVGRNYFADDGQRARAIDRAHKHWAGGT